MISRNCQYFSGLERPNYGIPLVQSRPECHSALRCGFTPKSPIPQDDPRPTVTVVEPLARVIALPGARHRAPMSHADRAALTHPPQRRIAQVRGPVAVEGDRVQRSRVPHAQSVQQRSIAQRAVVFDQRHDLGQRSIAEQMAQGERDVARHRLGRLGQPSQQRLLLRGPASSATACRTSPPADPRARTTRSRRRERQPEVRGSDCRAGPDSQGARARRGPRTRPPGSVAASSCRRHTDCSPPSLGGRSPRLCG